MIRPDRPEYIDSRIERLVERIDAGEVVFFVGAGFSVDSENNTAYRLVSRLVARFLALSVHLASKGFGVKPTETAPLEKTPADDLLNGLKMIFNLEGGIDTPARLMTEPNIKSLSMRYYLINDWMCSAFTELLDFVRSNKYDLEPIADFVAKVNDLENYFLDLVDPKSVDLQPMGIRDLLTLGETYPGASGKALFLETMGFMDEQVMAGDPMDSDLNVVADSYRHRLLPRHHVLARLAREGLCPILLTTNYDLLVEGAYRLAGFEWVPPARADDPPQPGPLAALPPSLFMHATRIASASQFTRTGERHRTARIVKIHGCVQNYREHSRISQTANTPAGSLEAELAAWEAYMRKMVFTYREIQNWREDAWSRDLVRTLLRTHTLVFCGYSGADPVIHDTLRTVYEEMHLQWNETPLPEETAPAKDLPPDKAEADRSVNPNGQSGDNSGEKTEGRASAPAFFLGLAGSKEFHGQELLRAASKSVGVPSPNLTDHPNHIEFQRGTDGFPGVDTVMLWIFHRSTRNRQARALDESLQRVGWAVFGRFPKDREVETIRKRFCRLVASERALLRSFKSNDDGTWETTDGSGQIFHRMIGWTYVFHPGLMREYAVVNAVGQSRRAALKIKLLREHAAYYPSGDKPTWTAWGVVMELALRSMIAEWRRVEPSLGNDWRWVWAAEGAYPTVLFNWSVERPAPIGLSIKLRGFDSETAFDAQAVGLKRHIIWEFQHDSVPWPRRPSLQTPSASVIWQWAAGRRHRNRLTQYLGKRDG